MRGGGGVGECGGGVGQLEVGVAGRGRGGGVWEPERRGGLGKGELGGGPDVAMVRGDEEKFGGNGYY